MRLQGDGEGQACSLSLGGILDGWKVGKHLKEPSFNRKVSLNVCSFRERTDRDSRNSQIGLWHDAVSTLSLQPDKTEDQNSTFCHVCRWKLGLLSVMIAMQEQPVQHHAGPSGTEGVSRLAEPTMWQNLECSRL